MIKHVVMWKLKDEFNGRSKKELATDLKQRLEALTDSIDALLDLQVGISLLEGDSEAHADVVLTTTHAHLEGLEAYRVHPDHQLVVAFALDIVKERRVVDYVIQ